MDRDGGKASPCGKAPSGPEVSHKHSTPALIHQATVLLEKAVDFHKSKLRLFIPSPLSSCYQSPGLWREEAALLAL